MGKSVFAAFLDLKKAFDSIDNCILLQRIGDLGVEFSPQPIMLKFLPNMLLKISPIMLLSVPANFIIFLNCFIRVCSGLSLHVTNYSFKCDCSIRVL